MQKRVNLFRSLGKPLASDKAHSVSIALGSLATLLLVIGGLLLWKAHQSKKNALLSELARERDRQATLATSQSRAPASRPQMEELEKGWYPLLWKLALGLHEEIIFHRVELDANNKESGRRVTIEAEAPSLVHVRDWSVSLRRRLPLSDFTLDEQRESPEGPVVFKVTLKTL